MMQLQCTERRKVGSSTRSRTLPLEGITIPATELLYHKNVFPPMGLTNLPLRAAFISAYSAGLIPFFLHFFSSASLSVAMSKLLAFHSPLDSDCCEFDEDEGKPTPNSDGRPEDMVMVELEELVRCER